jgi:hypothetical protein
MDIGGFLRNIDQGFNNWVDKTDFIPGVSNKGGTRTTDNGANWGKTLSNAVPTTPTNPYFDPANYAQPGDTQNQVLGDSIAPAYNGGAAKPALNMGAVNNTQTTIDQLGPLLEAALAAEATNKNNTIAGFNAAETTQRGQYDQSTTTNQQNYDANYMDSIRAGVKGLGNLFSILRGSGAAGGTAQDLVQDTVGGVTANDIRTGADTQQANQGQLDTTLSTFLTELGGKRQRAEDTFKNNESAIRRDNSTQLQDLYGKMAGYYGDAGQTDQANDWMGRAGSLTPQIANNSRTQVSSYDSTPVAVQAPQLTAFAAPAQPDVAVAPENGQVGSGIFTMNRRKEQQQQIPTALPAGV